MKCGFYFFIVSAVVFLTLPFCLYLFQKKEIATDQNVSVRASCPNNLGSELNLRGFSDLKKELGYEEPERFGAEESKNLIYGLIFGWMGFILIFSIGYYFFYVPSTSFKSSYDSFDSKVKASSRPNRSNDDLSVSDWIDHY